MKQLICIIVLTVLGVGLIPGDEVRPTDSAPNLTLNRVTVPELNNNLSAVGFKTLTETVILPEPVIPQRPAIPGNGYDAGNCTFFVKEQRPDLPNFLGNANQWLNSAVAEGFQTGSKPIKGAVAVTTAGGLGHVAYVTAVHDDSIEISEMNYSGLGVVTHRTTSVSEWNGFIL